ncbi:MAG: ACT domain-containing protein [Clostridiales Family XIII bacterium]|jgi:hypothetical protein|nr:ACT domain-containing protein [Clostridiales Family XIII bacterium]
MTIEQLSIFVENYSGRLADVADVIGGAGINMHAMSIADTADFGILRAIVSDSRQAKEALSSAGYVVTVTPVVAAAIQDTPGGLAKVLRILADADISIEYIYAFITRRKGDAYVVFRVADNERAAAVFAENGIRTISARDIDEL